MKYAEDTKRFQELTEKFGNPYAAVRYIAQTARTLADKTDNLILHSEAISWALRGEKPEILSKLDILPRRNNFRVIYTDEVLSYVDDVAVKESVRESLYCSKQAKNLVYIYKNVSDEPRQARVRILTRMIWYELYPHIK